MDIETDMSEAAQPPRLHSDDGTGSATATVRAAARARALECALFKLSRGVPTYTVPEAAALLSVSPEALYRLVRGEIFPALRVGQKYSVPAAAVADLIDQTARAGQRIEIEEWGPSWTEHRRSASGGAA